MINVLALVGRLRERAQAFAEECDDEHNGRPIPAKRERERLANLGFIVSQLGGLLAGLGQAMTAAAHDAAERAAAAAHDQGFTAGAAARADVDQDQAADVDEDAAAVLDVDEDQADEDAAAVLDEDQGADVDELRAEQDRAAELGDVAPVDLAERYGQF